MEGISGDIGAIWVVNLNVFVGRDAPDGIERRSVNLSGIVAIDRAPNVAKQIPGVLRLKDSPPREQQKETQIRDD
jgi:hypothetical protein